MVPKKLNCKIKDSGALSREGALNRKGAPEAEHQRNCTCKTVAFVVVAVGR